MNTHNIALLGFAIVLFSSILPWPWGGGVTLSLLSFYWGVIFAILSGFGIFGASAFTVSNWQSFAQLAMLIVFPVGIYFTYKAIADHNPSIYQGLVGILPGVLSISASFTTIPPFNRAEGAYIAILGGIILELGYFMGGSRSSGPIRHHYSRNYSHTYERTPVFYWVAALAIALLINILLFFNLIQPNTGLHSLLNSLANFILYLPGIIVLPLIIGMLIGREVGHSARTIKYAARIGFLKSIYACLTYVVSIIILYLILFYTINSAPSLQYLIEYWLVLPSAVLMIASVIGALVSYSKHLE